ncbi:hypothetical protein ACMHYO_19370 [Allopusillimonas ginsengisoli]|uniref:hypothetical protein n=1 Tax=Allopusillimonas ginsengisoli TaxID=453575 RepID=UPI0039C2FC74
MKRYAQLNMRQYLLTTIMAIAATLASVAQATRLPTHPANRVKELLPHSWSPQAAV